MTIQSCRLHTVPGLLYIHYLVSCAVQFSPFSDTNEGLPLTCFEDSVKVAASVIALGYCNDSLVGWQQAWGGGDGQILNLDIQMGKTIRQCSGAWLWIRRTLGATFLDFRCSLPHHTNTDSHFRVTSSSHTYRALSNFRTRGGGNDLHSKLLHSMEEWP